MISIAPRLTLVLICRNARLATAAAAAAVVLALVAAPAQAAVHHSFLTSFAAPGAGGADLSLAVDNSSGASAGDLYAAGVAGGVIDKFGPGPGFAYLCQITGGGSASTSSSECDKSAAGTPSGNLGSPEGPAVDPASGDVYVPDVAGGVVNRFSSAGAFESQIAGFSTPYQVAFGQASGDLYVINLSAGSVSSYDTATQTVSTFASGLSRPFGVAVDNSAGPSAGDVYVSENGSGVVDRFSSSGALLGQITGPSGGSFQSLGQLAVDPVGGDLYVVDFGAGVVDQFDPAGNFLGQLTAAQTPSGAMSPWGVTVRASTGDVYVGDTSNGDRVDVFGPTLLLPDVTTTPASGASLTAATLNGTLNPDGTTITDCHFGYVDDAHYNPSAPDPYGAGQTAPCASIPSGSSPVPVSAAVSGLTPGTLYHFRLEASNDNGTGDGADQTFATGAVIASEWSSAVTSVAATVNASINPEGSDTTYHFEYGLTTGYGTSVPVPDADIGAGTTNVAVGQTLEGLQPATTYHYRVVVTRSGGTVDGPDHTFTTYSPPAPQSCPNAQFRAGPSASLPDCRAWEQVSPVDKSGVDAFQAAFGTGVHGAPDGNGLMYQSLTAYANPQSSGLPNAYLATRTAAGWQTANVSPPTPDPVLAGGFQLDYQFSADLSQAVYAVPAQAVAPGAAPNVDNLFLRHPDGSFSTITNAPRAIGCPPGNPYGALCFQINSKTTFGGASSDFSHIIFEANDSLTPDAPGGGVNNLYESAGGHVSFAGYLPDGAAAASGSQAGSGDPANLSTVTAQDVTNAISADGSRIFFDAAADGGGPDSLQSGLTEIYERVNGSSTVEVSAPAAGATPANSTPEPALYWGASADGSLVFFTSSAELTTNANTGSGNAGNDLYEFNTTTGGLTDLSVDTSPGDAATGANVQGVVGSSSDGSYVYFVANGQFHLGQGVDGQPNLYVTHDGGPPKFIATLSPGDANNWINQTRFLTSYVTPDGRHLALTSTLPLTGYDNTDQSSGQPDAEVFEYSAASGQLVCGSCDPTGAEPVGSAFIGNPHLPQAFYHPRVLSDDGSRLFFSSPDALTPGVAGAHVKVYEYEGGAVRLIGGAASGDDQFIDASASGGDVFIASRDQLAASDQDQLVDVYDARVGGGFPAAVGLPPCQADACQGALTASPSLSVAASVGFSGPGNPSPAASPTAGKAKLLRHAVSGDRFALTVQVPAPGTISVSGNRLRAARTTVTHAGSYRLTVGLTPAARRLLARRGRLMVTAEVRYLPAGAAVSTATVHVSFTHTVRKSR